MGQIAMASGMKVNEIKSKIFCCQKCQNKSFFITQASINNNKNGKQIKSWKGFNCDIYKTNTG